MKYLVTGGAGFIGNRVVRILESLGHSVIIADNKTTYGVTPQSEVNSLMKQRLDGIKSQLMHFDVNHTGDMGWAIEKHQPDTIIHLASYPRQKIVDHNAQHAAREMVEGLVGMLGQTARRRVPKFVFVSSSMVYGNFSGAAKEDDILRPQGQYGIMKYTGEMLVRDYGASTNLNWTIVRPSAVYGQMDVNARVMSKYLRTAMAGGILEVRGHDEMLDFTYVDDTAMGIVLAATNDIANNKIYNISRGHAMSLLRAAELVIREVGSGNIKCSGKDVSFPSRGSLDISKAEIELGFAPAVYLEEGIKRYYEWMKQGDNSLLRV